MDFERYIVDVLSTLPLIFVVGVTAAVAGMIYFAWLIYRGNFDLFGEDYLTELEASERVAKVNPAEFDDPTLWLPEFAKTTKINVVDANRGRWFPFRGKSGSVVHVTVTKKSQKQMVAEKRAFFEAKEKRT